MSKVYNINRLLDEQKKEPMMKNIGKVGKLDVHMMEFKDGNKYIEIESRKEVLSIDTRDFDLDELIKAIMLAKKTNK